MDGTMLLCFVCWRYHWITGSIENANHLIPPIQTRGTFNQFQHLRHEDINHKSPITPQKIQNASKLES